MPSRPRLADAPWLVLDALVGWLAAWQLFALVAVYAGLSFDVLTVLGVVAFGGLLLPLWTRPWEIPTREEAPAPEVRWWWVALALLPTPLAQVGLQGRWMAVGVMALIGSGLFWNLYFAVLAVIAGFFMATAIAVADAQVAASS